MEKEGIPWLERVVQALNHDQSQCQLQWEKARLYELDPWDFLEFTRADLEEGSERGRLNGIGNARRAIACRVDEILTLSYLRSFMAKEKWGLPYKLEVIKKLGCPGPYVLREYITSRRNTLEHEYRKPPDMEETRHIVDITELFLRATDQYVGRGYLRRATVEVKGQEEVQTERQRETRHLVKLIYDLHFDFAGEQVTVKFWPAAEETVTSRRTGQITSQDSPLVDPTSSSLRIVDCGKEAMAELMRLLRAKSQLAA